MSSPAELEFNSVSLSSYLRLVRDNPNFRRLWMAQIVSEIGDWFYTLAIYSLLLQLTGRASSVALALVLQVLPWTFVGPTVGIVNDRISRRRVMITADIVRAVIVCSMVLVRSASMVWLVYPLLLVETIMAAFFEPARNAVIPNITAAEDVIVANTLSSTTWSMNLVLGAAVGGLVAALLGRDAVFVLNAVSFVVSALLITGMRFDEPHAAPGARLRARDLLDFSFMREGFRYIRRNARLTATVLLKAGLLVIGPSWVLFTVMGKQNFPVRWPGVDLERGAMLGMSLLMAARGVGALIGPVVATRWSGQRQSRIRTAILIGFVAEALGYIGLGFAGNVWIACAWIVLAHCGGSIVWVFSTTLLQLNTDDRFRGRVFSADTSLAMFTIAVGAFVVGRFLDAGFSAATLCVAAGSSMLVPAALWASAMRLWRNSEPLLSAESG